MNDQSQDTSIAEEKKSNPEEEIREILKDGIVGLVKGMNPSNPEQCEKLAHSINHLTESRAGRVAAHQRWDHEPDPARLYVWSQLQLRKLT